MCHYAKQKKLPFHISKSRATSRFDLLHMDLCGPFSVNSIHNQKYFLAIVDDFSRFTWIVLLKRKFETLTNSEVYLVG